MKSISEQEVLAAQKAWGEAIVAIGAVKESKEKYMALAEQALDDLYGYDLGGVAFKPTKAAEKQFRPSKEEALSYFVGGCVAEDTGFALNPWTCVRFGEQSIFIRQGFAIAQGNYYFTDAKSGEEVKVEFSFCYIKNEKGALQIVMHHSSLPYGAA